MNTIDIPGLLKVNAWVNNPRNPCHLLVCGLIRVIRPNSCNKIKFAASYRK